MAFADGLEVLHESGVKADEITLIGGGSRSVYWRQLLADVLNCPLTSREGGDVGPALGAARLALLAVKDDSDLKTVCQQPLLAREHQPIQHRVQVYQERRGKFTSLYRQLKDFF